MSKEEEMANLITMNGQTLALGESCTGGLLSHLITNIPGASAFFKGGAVVYDNVAKTEVLGVPTDCLRF